MTLLAEMPRELTIMATIIVQPQSKIMEAIQINQII